MQLHSTTGRRSAGDRASEGGRSLEIGAFGSKRSQTLACHGTTITQVLSEVSQARGGARGPLHMWRRCWGEHCDSETTAWGIGQPHIADEIAGDV